MPLTEKGRYLDFFTDFGFRKLFGSEPNKGLLIDFLNELLRDKQHIRNLYYSNNEQLGRTSEFRRALKKKFHISC